MSKKGIISKKDKYIICKFCGNSFAAHKQLSARGYTQYNMAAKFCSKSCAGKYPEFVGKSRIVEVSESLKGEIF